ncbi:trihelix transcription factor ASR3-like isoform X1 [Solanum stenotomum]|uniref:trihelix transcription factor ASR3-like isoform X1 n=1 Tax=Solanum stenotomum TaxID=172797 RepID=UPI0020D068F0|nr:trihelix transcription factor ASR3-like isoform X1 [Solanum stenotomum]
MKLERLTLIPSTDSDGRLNGADDSNKVPRLPRWTRQEILVLIQGKKVAENRIRRGRTGVVEFGSPQVEPKWASVSSYCKRHGVNRGPVQCRKRWSNLAGDFKKIKEWESQIKEETDSFWVMRNDLRRDKKLPGFFDREVYDILDRGSGDGDGNGDEEGGLVLALGSQVLFDSGKSAAVSGDDALFSDFEPDETPHKPINDPPIPTPISEQQHQPLSQVSPTQAGTSQPTTREPDIGSGQEGRKRKKSESDADDEEARSVQHHLVRALERNGKLVSSQLEAQNMQFEQDREQRKDHVDNLVAVLTKLADALGRIADKL